MCRITMPAPTTGRVAAFRVMRGMNRRKFLAGLVSIIATPALAQDNADGIIRQLQQLGFRKFRVSRTWLGRVRIVAEKTGVQREIIVNPRSGEILRDYTRTLEATGKTTGNTVLSGDAGSAAGGNASAGVSGDDSGDDAGDDAGDDGSSGDDGAGDDGGGDGDGDGGDGDGD